MNHFNILIPIALIYIGMIYVLFNFLKKDHAHDFEINNATTSDVPMTVFASKFLNFLFFIQLIAIFIIPIITLVMTFTNTNSGSWGIDMSVFAGFKIDLNQIEGIEALGVRNPEFNGRTMIDIDTSSLGSWYLSIAIKEMYLFTSLYIVYQLRILMISIRKGLALSFENSNRIKNIGIVIMVLCILIPFIQYFIWGSIVKDITFNTQGFYFYPAFEFNLRSFSIGFMLVILARVLQEAAEIKKEQELTI